jgi:hypothetical protein
MVSDIICPKGPKSLGLGFCLEIKDIQANVER